MTLAAGTKLGRYEIRSQLGAGGMGEVYLARDTQLDRSIALKILPAEVASNSDRMRRFVQEARAAATLNHPNIAHIYEIGRSPTPGSPAGQPGWGGAVREGADKSLSTSNETQFIAMEHVAGETLRHRLKHSGLRLGEALDVTTQIASAVAAAHRAGIIHRDLKPENIMLTPEGYVKVLDFGLAKLTEHPAANSAVSTLIDTDPGMIIGTAQYMSPEQARGLDMDARTDIWSLGVVLYEMVTGHVPFEGATKSDMIASILEREPRPLTSHLPDLPPELWRIVRKALRKDREERYQTIKDLGLDVKNLRREMELEAELEYSAQPAISGTTATSGRYATLSGAAPSTATAEAPHHMSSAEYIVSEIKRHKAGLLVILGVAILAFVGLVFGIYKYVGRPSTSSASMKLTKLTSSGKAGAVAISPDGRYVVHTVQETEGISLWMRQVATSSSVQIVPASDKWIYGVIFSPDGNYIYYVAAEKGSPSGTLYQMPVLGGAPKKLVEDLATPVTISPDGKQAVFIRSDLSKGEDSLTIASLDGAKERKLITRKPPNYFVTYEGAPAWSPDGKTIAYAGYVAGSGKAYEINVFEVRVADGTEKVLPSAQKLGWIDALAWLPDGSGLLLNGSELGAQSSQIWQLSRSGEMRRITNDPNDYYGIDLTADSKTIATDQYLRTSNIWVAPSGDLSRAKQITSGTNNYGNVDWTPDGRLVVVESYRDIWIMDSDGSRQNKLTTEGRNFASSVCGDTYIVFSSNREDTTRIWRMNADGTNQKQLTSGYGEFLPSCSPDGKWVLYQDNSSGVPTVWRVPIDGGDPVQLTNKLSIRPIVSPDGKLIAIRYMDDPARRRWGMALIPFEGGEPVKLLDISAYFVRWSRDGRALEYLDNRGGSSNLWSQPIDGSPRKQLADFKSDRLFAFAWSTDGKQLAVSRGVDAEDVVLISNFR
jgi:serine/threonine protein kinase/Tol biopolymer transport system component